MGFNQLGTYQFKDRGDAGRQLVARLPADLYRQPDTIVLALPRGGLPVAHEVAAALELPLDICLVRKLGVPGHPELAMGAIAASGVRVLSHDLIDRLNIQPAWIDRVTALETRELQRRERVYRQGFAPLTWAHKTVVLVDDGIATGATLRAAIAILKKLAVKAIIVAVPVAHPAVIDELKPTVDDVICVITPERLQSISLWYQEFDQTSDDTVKAILRQHNETAANRAAQHYKIAGNG